MKLIKQKNKSDCAIAAIAMLVGKSYVEAKDKWLEPIRWGMEVDHVLYLLQQFTQYKRLHVRRGITADDWAAAHEATKALLFVENGAIGFDLCLHTVVACDGHILNPAPDADGCSRKVVSIYSMVVKA